MGIRIPNGLRYISENRGLSINPIHILTNGTCGSTASFWYLLYGYVFHDIYGILTGKNTVYTDVNQSYIALGIDLRTSYPTILLLSVKKSRVNFYILSDLNLSHHISYKPFIYIYIHIHRCIYIYMRIHTYLNIYIYISTHIHLYIHTYIHISLNITQWIWIFITFLQRVTAPRTRLLVWSEAQRHRVWGRHIGADAPHRWLEVTTLEIQNGNRFYNTYIYIYICRYI